MKSKREKIWKNVLVRGVCGVLAVGLALTLTGCGSKDGAKEGAEVKTQEKAAAVEDGTLSEDSVVIGVGGTKVLWSEYKTYNWFLINQYEALMSPDVWNYNMEGVTVRQAAVEDVLRLIIQIKLMNKEAQVQGITLGVDEKEDVDYKADQYLATISPEVQAANGMTAESLHRVFEENEIARKIYDVVTGNVEANVDEANMQAAKVLMLHLEADESNRDTVKKQIEGMAAELSAYSGNFYSFVREKTGKAPEETIIGKMDSRTTLVNTALGMKKGMTSGVIEEADGFYLIHCLKCNTRGLNKVYREQYITELQNKTFQAAYENWAEKYEVKVSKSLLAADGNGGQ